MFEWLQNLFTGNKGDGTDGPVKPKKRDALGDRGENVAARYLRNLGYKIIIRNFRCDVGEIDIVARRGNLLIFVEVKARATFDDAAYSVTPRQQQRIAAAAAIWLADNESDAQRDMRFDAILVAPRRWPRHVEAAFET